MVSASYHLLASFGRLRAMILGGYHPNKSEANKKIVVGFPLSLGNTRDWVFAIFVDV
jgi:hypothetical protein